MKSCDCADRSTSLRFPPLLAYAGVAGFFCLLLLEYSLFFFGILGMAKHGDVFNTTPDRTMFFREKNYRKIS